MTEFEKVLEECLYDLEQDASTVEECLSRHPGYALQLRPVLLTTEYLQHGREARPSAAFKVRVRAKLIQGIQAHPRKFMQFNFIWIRPAMSLAIAVLALLVAGTAYAQAVLPGDAFYAWKLASENAWRAISPDPVGTDLALAERRMDELIAVSDNQDLYSQALKMYLEVVARLKSEVDTKNEARILQTLDSQMEQLNSAGIFLPQPDQELLPLFDELTPTPTITSLPTSEIPEVSPTDLPGIVPTITTQIPEVNPTALPKIVPTIQVPPELIPTIEVPPLIP